MFTEQELQNRIAAIHKEMEAAKSNYSRLEGHLQEAVYWLKEMATKNHQPESKETDHGEDNDEPTEEVA